MPYAKATLRAFLSLGGAESGVKTGISVLRLYQCMDRSLASLQIIHTKLPGRPRGVFVGSSP